MLRLSLGYILIYVVGHSCISQALLRVLMNYSFSCGLIDSTPFFSTYCKHFYSTVDVHVSVCVGLCASIHVYLWV